MKRNLIECIFLSVIMLALFMFGYWIGTNEARQAAPCVNQCIGTKTVWDVNKKTFFHTPIIRCLKPGVEK